MPPDLAQEWEDYLDGVLADPSLSAARQGLASWEVDLGQGQRGGLAELAELLTTTHRLLLVAPPGWGKTTLLKAILHDYAFYARHYQEADLSTCLLCEERRLPLYLDLSQTEAPVWGHHRLSQHEDLATPSDEDLLILIDHPEKGVPNLAGALKRLLSSPHRLVVAARDHDAPPIRPWLFPTTEIRLLPLGEEAAFRLLLAQEGDAVAQRAVQLLTTHRLWALAQTPALLHRLGQLASSGSLWGASRREILEQLCRHILGPPPSPTWLALAELARLIKARAAPERPQALSLLGGEVALESLMSQGLLRWEGERLCFAHQVVQMLFLAYAWEDLLAAGGHLGKALEGAPEEALLFLYDLSSHRQALLRELLASPSQEAHLSLAARCLAQRPSPGPTTGLRGLPPGIVDPAIYLGLGRAFRRLGRLEEARLALEEGLRLAPERPDLRWELAQVEMARGRSQTALGHYGRLRASMPPALAWPLDEARAQAQAGQLPEALAQAQETTQRLAQELGEAHQLLARLWEESGQPTLALEAAQAAAQVCPGASTFALWGRLLEEQGQTGEARARLEQAVLLDLRSVEARLALARFLESSGDLSAAIAQLKEAVALDGDCAQAQRDLGRAYRAAGAYPQARFHLERALALASGPGPPFLAVAASTDRLPLAEAHAELALLEENQGRPKEALYHIRLALDLAPERAPYRFDLGWVLAELGRPADAEAALKQALAAQPQQAAWHDRLGHFLLSQERAEEARGEFATAVSLEPGNPLYRFNLGVALGLLGQVLQALEALEKAIELASQPHPNRSVVEAVVVADAHRERGRLLEGLGRTAEAVAEYQRAAALLPHHSGYRLSQAVAYGRLGQHGLMLGTLEQTVRMNPQDALAHFLLGQAYQTLGRYPEAAACLERACSAAGGEPEAGNYFLAWGGLLRHLAQNQAALAALQRAAELLPQSALGGEAHHQLGGLLEETGDLKAALAEYRAAARHQVSNATYWTAVGRVLRHLGQGPEAMMALRTAISLHPAPSPAHAELSRALAEAGRLKEAHEAALQAASAGTEAQYWVEAAHLAHRLGEADQALTHLDEALRLDPERADLWAERGQGLTEQEQWEEARDALARAYQIAPHQQEYALHLSQVYLRLGHPAQARDALLPLVQQHPQWAAGRLALAESLIALGDSVGALEQCQLVLHQGSSGTAYGLMAEALAKAGRWEEAIAPLEKATALEPEEPHWMDLLGQLHLAQGRPDLAEAALNQALACGAPSRTQGRLGQALLAQGRYEEATAALAPALSSAHLAAQERLAFLQALGDAQRALEQPQEAWASYEAALELADAPEERTSLRRRRGEHLLAAGPPQAAIAELEAALPGGDQGPELHLLLAQACRQAGEWEAALAHARRAAQAQPQAAAPQREMGIILRLRGEPGPAIKALEAALASDPRDAAAWAELGQAYAQVGSAERARSALEQAVREAPGESRFRLLIGEWLLWQGSPAEALSQAEQALRLAPPPAPAEALRAQALAGLGRLEEATAAMARAIALDPQQGEYHLRLGQWQRRLGDQEAALAALRQAVALAPDRAQWRLELGRLHGEMESWAEADAVLQPLAEAAAEDSPPLSAPEGAEVAYLLGSALFRRGHPQEALPHLIQAVEHDSERASYQRELGRAYLALGQPQAAIEPLEKALQMPLPSGGDRPQWEEVALLLAEAYQGSARLDTAEWLILKVIHQNPQSASGYAVLARLRGEQQRLPEAAAAWGQAVAQAPGRGEYLLGLAEALSLLGQDQAAQDALEQVHTTDPATWEGVGRLCERLGSPQRALPAYEQAAALEPTPGRLIQVAHAARRGGQAARAREALEAALRLSSQESAPTPKGSQAAWHNELGELLAEQGELEPALASFQRAVELAPQEPRLRRNLGLLLESLGRLESARAELERARHLDPTDEVAFRHLGAVSARLTLERWRRSQRASPSPARPSSLGSGSPPKKT